MKNLSWIYYVLLAYKNNNKKELSLKEIHEEIKNTVMEFKDIDKINVINNNNKTWKQTVNTEITKRESNKKSKGSIKFNRVNKGIYEIVGNIEDLLKEAMEVNDKKQRKSNPAKIIKDKNGNVTHKECTGCHEIKDIKEFGELKREGNGHWRAKCRDCTNKTNKEKKEENYSVTIRINMKELEERYNITRGDLRNKVKISEAKIKQLYNENAVSVDLDTINKLMNFLGLSCTLYDFFEIKEYNEKQYKKIHALREPNKEYRIDISNYYEAIHDIRNISLEEFAEKLELTIEKTKELINGTSKNISYKTLNILMNNYGLKIESIFVY